MSISAIAWVFQQEIKPSSLKFILVALADCADDTGICWPSVDHLVQTTCQDRKTVISGITELEKRGLLMDTGKRMGKTNQVKVYRLNGLPSSSAHYVYRLTNTETGEFYIGVRSTTGSIDSDPYMGSGAWPAKMTSQGVKLAKLVVAQFSNRQEAEIYERRYISENVAQPLCRNKVKGPVNGTVSKSTENGMLKESRFSAQTVPSLPAKSTENGFSPTPPKEADPSIEPSTQPAGTREASFYAKCFEHIVTKFSNLMTANPSPIHQWEQAGYDFERHVRPTVDSLAAKGAEPRSFKFFTPALADAAVALPKANSNPAAGEKPALKGTTVAELQRKNDIIQRFQSGGRA